MVTLEEQQRLVVQVGEPVAKNPQLVKFPTNLVFVEEWQEESYSK